MHLAQFVANHNLQTLPCARSWDTHSGQSSADHSKRRARRFDLLWLIGSQIPQSDDSSFLLSRALRSLYSLHTDFWTHWTQHASVQCPLPAERLTNHVNGALLHCATNVNAHGIYNWKYFNSIAWVIVRAACYCDSCCCVLLACTQLSALRACVLREEF